VLAAQAPATNRQPPPAGANNKKQPPPARAAKQPPAPAGAKQPAPPAGGRPPAAATPAPAAPSPRKPTTGAKKDESREPRSLTLETSDGVALKAVYFPGNRGKETVPIIMLHGWEERGVVWEPLAGYLQKSFGHAVLVPDLRGHGGSLTQVAGAQSRQLEPDDLTPADMEAMVLDVQACKKFLQEENNKGEVNLEMLTLVAAEYGAIVALQFAAVDWSWPLLTTGKQGQDVKALALLTPLDRFKRVTAAKAVQSLRAPIITGKFSILVMAGQQDRGGYSDAKRLHRQLEGMYANDLKETALWLVTPDTNSHGKQLIEPERRLGMERALSDFIQRRVVDRGGEFGWTERKSPLQR
jgi:pimeloyl-ACP methyl ester carboxylesterase